MCKWIRTEEEQIAKDIHRAISFPSLLHSHGTIMISTTTLVYLSPFTEAKIINNLPNIVYHCLTLS